MTWSSLSMIYSFMSNDGFISSTDLVGTFDMSVGVSISWHLGPIYWHGLSQLMDVSLKDIVCVICLSLSIRDITGSWINLKGMQAYGSKFMPFGYLVFVGIGDLVFCLRICVQTSSLSIIKICCPTLHCQVDNFHMTWISDLVFDPQ